MIDKNSSVDELTIGGNIYDAGNARCFKTGDWRSVKPIFISEKCNNIVKRKFPIYICEWEVNY